MTFNITTAITDPPDPLAELNALLEMLGNFSYDGCIPEFNVTISESLSQVMRHPGVQSMVKREIKRFGGGDNFIFNIHLKGEHHVNHSI